MKFNKIKLIAGLCLALGVSALGQNNVGTLVTDPIRPFSVSSTHPSAIANEIKGGPFSSSNLVGLSNIPAPRLEIGAIGYATNTGLYYRLTATNPATWSSINGANITNVSISNVTGTIAISNGGTGATNAGGARTNLGLGSVSSNSFNVTDSAIYTLTNFVVTNGVAFFGGGGGSYFATFESTNTGFAGFIGGVGYFHNGSNVWYVDTNGMEFSAPSVVRSNLGLSFAALTNTNASNFRTAIGATTIGHSLFTATNSAAAINAIGLSTNFSDQVLSVSNIFIGSFPSSAGFVVPTSGKTLMVAGTNVSTGIPAFFGWNGFLGVAFSAAEARTNLGLNAWTTNTNSPVFVGTNGEVVSPTNFWQVAPIVTRFVESQPTTNQTTNIPAARNLHIHSLAISTVGVTNTIALPTNNAFNGDIALVVHQGPTSSVTQIRTAGSTNNLVAMNRFDEAVEFVYYNNVWQFNHNRSFIEPIYFSGTNASANAAASRTNLGLGATNNVIFSQVDAVSFFVDEGSITFSGDAAATTRTNLGLGATNNVEFNNITIADQTLTLSHGPEENVFVRNESGNLELEADSSIIAFSPVVASSTLTATSTVTAKTNLVVEGFVNYTAARTNNTPTNTPNFAAHAAWIEVKIGTNSFFLPAYQ